MRTSTLYTSRAPLNWRLVTNNYASGGWRELIALSNSTQTSNSRQWRANQPHLELVATTFAHTMGSLEISSYDVTLHGIHNKLIWRQTTRAPSTSAVTQQHAKDSCLQLTVLKESLLPFSSGRMRLLLPSLQPLEHRTSPTRNEQTSLKHSARRRPANENHTRPKIRPSHLHPQIICRELFLFGISNLAQLQPRVLLWSPVSVVLLFELITHPGDIVTISKWRWAQSPCNKGI